MTKTQKVGAMVAIADAVFWIGGNYSFDYTHKCVRSHTEQQVINSDGDTQTVTVCDFYSANAKRRTLLDPARAVADVANSQALIVFDLVASAGLSKAAPGR